jgi:2-polyprenyl-3-methyl-5-hydroxy-6-metoxy-1,4-benzoquinol methylase
MAEPTPSGDRARPPGSPWKRAARAGVHRVLDVGRVRSIVESDLAARRRGGNGTSSAGTNATPFAAGTTFTDRHGTRHVLDPALRDRLKPRWRTMFDPAAATRMPTAAELAGRAKAAERNVAEAQRLVSAVTGASIGGRVLEVGCHDGAVAWQLSRIPGAEVVASDMARYYVVQSEPKAGGETADPAAAIAVEQQRLADLRGLARTAAGANVGAVEFVEDDITASVLEPASLDAVVSFEVIEHVADPPAAFAAIARLLRPGGITYHDYNPFFAINGGHSLGTLDLPWGQVRLDDSDIERYLHEVRPAEADRALGFVREALNRLTLAGLDAALRAAGLEVLAVVPWVDRKLVADLTPEVLAEVRANHPTATANDLLATFVSVVARRPPAPS